MKKETIENVVGLIHGDVYVDVKIQFKEMMPTRTAEEKLALDKLNNELGVLGFEIQQSIKEKINSHFNPRE